MKRNELTGKIEYDPGFPMYGYHKTKGAKLFMSEAESEAEGEGYLDNPGKHLEAKHKEHVPIVAPKKAKDVKEASELEKEAEALKLEIELLKKEKADAKKEKVK